MTVNLMFFAPINWGAVGISLSIAVGIALVLGIAIMLVAKFFAQKDEDPRIEQVRDKLAGANCGSCGFAGCDDYAKALVEGRATLDACGVTNSAGKETISTILGMEYKGEEAVAVVACMGGNNCATRYNYEGYSNCINQQMLAQGAKGCLSGCLGMGSCALVCPQGAIKVTDGVATVDKDICISCGQCIAVCPKSIVKRIPKRAKVYIACSSHCKGKEVSGQCSVGCIGCTLCAKNCPKGAITMVDNLPVIDYDKCDGCKTCLAKCPRKIIRRLD